ncbi:MAG: class I SAM-dependent methyltransferase [Actinomycetia bacterium]|nr:class I SAM-dependent methyltransferase [Actinomycetes bacterium]
MALLEDELPTSGVVVEIGYGPVTDLPRLLSGLGTAQAVGIDIDQQALRDAPTPGLNRVCADGSRLPFRSRSLSAILMRAVLHHIVDIDTCLADCTASLKAGGRLIIEDGVALEPDDAARMNDELRGRCCFDG